MTIKQKEKTKLQQSTVFNIKAQKPECNTTKQIKEQQKQQHNKSNSKKQQHNKTNQRTAKN